MKKTILSLFTLLAIALGANAQGYSLKATVEGIADGTKVVLVPMSHDQEDPIAEATVSDGKFFISGKVDFPRAVFLMVKNAYGTAEFMLENADITLSASASKGKSHDGSVYYTFTNLKVTGSPLTDRLLSYLNKREDLNKIYDDYHRRYADIMKKISDARMAKDKALVDSLSNTEEGKLIQYEMDVNYGLPNAFWGPMFGATDNPVITTGWGKIVDMVCISAE